MTADSPPDASDEAQASTAIIEPALDGERFDFVVVANRLPADCTIDDDGTPRWSRSPGGLVSALEPVMRERGGAWVGWAGLADAHFDPFDSNGVRLIPVDLSRLEVERYYEGFSNGTLWPLYHDVIAAPSYHREWWLAYVRVNERFASRAAEVAAEGATVWVHDYQLQLVPRLLREQRPDLTIGFFNHIPFPPYGIFSQLPWRRQIIMGLLGADVVGFQRATDAANFSAASKRLNGATPETLGTRVKHVPISIDAASYDELGRRPEIIERAREIRESYGGRRILFGVDRLDYTKGIGHRIKAFGELIASGQLDVGEAVLMQVASPSRERVGPYRELRDEVELMVGRLNGDHSTIDHSPVAYYHQTFGREEMAAMYLAADVMLVTALRDGMNLVAKEFVATRSDLDGVLVLSEFAGASDELRRAVLVNPHDIDGLKAAMLRGLAMSHDERSSRMRSMRKRVFSHDVANWSQSFLHELEKARR